MKISPISIIIGMLLWAACQPAPQTEGQQGRQGPSSSQKKIKKQPVKFSLQDYYSEDSLLAALTDSIVQGMTTAGKIGQTLIIFGGEQGYTQKQLRYWIRTYKPGGITFLKGQADTIGRAARTLQTYAGQNACLPLLFSADAEPALLNQKIKGLDYVPYTYRITNPGVSTAVAGQIADILHDMHLHQNFAPVCDLDANRAIIGRRSHGSDVAKVGKLAAAFVRGTQAQQVVATAKHFPGHGHAAGDTHKQLVFLDGSIPEIPVFRQAIGAGVLSIMAGHIAVQNHPRYNTGGLPASISPVILQTLLRGSLHFQGLIISDALNMGAVLSIRDVALKAFLAGCDMVMQPSSIKNYVENLTTEAQNQPQVRKRLDESVRRVVRLKICLGLLPVQAAPSAV